MANVKPYEVIAGPCEVYFAPTGTAFPAVSGTVPPAWTHIGLTEGGIRVGHPQTVVEHRADQVTGPIKATRTEEGLEITFSLVNLTLERYALALNRAISGPTSGAGQKSLPMYRGGFQVETFAFLARGNNLSPYANAHLQYQVPVVFNAGSPEATFTKENKAMLEVSLHAIVDPDRSSDDESFGRLVAATS